MEYISVRVSDIIRQIGKDLFLPAIQREFVWSPDQIERLFDSIMTDFPVGSFLYWQLNEDKKNEWPIYEFIREFDEQSPHNPAANLAGINKDITLVLDGQQRITSLYIGLKGSYTYFHYRRRKTRLYLNLLKPPVPNEDNPEELTYGFSFRENTTPSGETPQLWYLVGDVLNYEDAEDAKSAMKAALAACTDDERDNASKLIGRLHSRIHTTLVGNYYLERSQDYEKVLQIFVRANSAGAQLEYSDLLLATATAKWERLDARKEIYDFTDRLNEIGAGYSFGRDFVLKASLYLSESNEGGLRRALPIAYKVKNFTRANLRVIEDDWENTKESLTSTVKLIYRFGFTAKNIVAPLALLPIAFYLKRRGNSSFDTSSEASDAQAQVAIRRWFVFSTLKGAFGASSDSVLSRLRELLNACDRSSPFPAEALYKALAIEPKLNNAEIDRMFSMQYQGRYTNLVLSLLYPDRDWKDAKFHEDHIFPKSDFQVRELRNRGYDDVRIQSYVSKFNNLANLQLLTESENIKKNDTEFEEWIATREPGFAKRHLIPKVQDFRFDSFESFYAGRQAEIRKVLEAL